VTLRFSDQDDSARKLKAEPREEQEAQAARPEIHSDGCSQHFCEQGRAGGHPTGDPFGIVVALVE
jgi:hypothetical protein